MSHGTIQSTSSVRRSDLSRRSARIAVFATTFVLVLAALTVSVALVVYTAWHHDLLRGVFALLFAVLSAQMALNWLLWKNEPF